MLGVKSVGRLLFVLLVVCEGHCDSDEAEWESFKIKYGKVYGSPEEESTHFNIFQQNLRAIEKATEKFNNGEISYKLGINKFADVTLEEFSTSIKLFNSDLNRTTNTGNIGSRRMRRVRDDEVIPESIDWRQIGAVSDVKDELIYYQGYSWAFSVAASVEAQVYLTIQSLISLSAQNLIDCEYLSKNVTDWVLDFAFSYVGDYGILSEQEYPYSGSKGPCLKQGERGVFVGLVIGLTNEYELEESVGTDGPVTVVMDASRLSNYESGIVDSSRCNNTMSDLNHSVLIVGYNTTEDGKSYWIAKNSWGMDWGEDGYFKLAKFANNTCGVGLSPMYPVIVHDKYA